MKCRWMNYNSVAFVLQSKLKHLNKKTQNYGKNSTKATTWAVFSPSFGGKEFQIL